MHFTCVEKKNHANQTCYHATNDGSVPKSVSWLLKEVYKYFRRLRCSSCAVIINEISKLLSSPDLYCCDYSMVEDLVILTMAI